MAKPRYELWGESLRELGVLLFVFVPLDFLVEYFRAGARPDRQHWEIIGAFAAIGIMLMLIGVEVERR